MSEDIREAAREALKAKTAEIMGGEEAPEATVEISQDPVEEYEPPEPQFMGEVNEEEEEQVSEAGQEEDPKRFETYEEYIERGGDPL